MILSLAIALAAVASAYRLGLRRGGHVMWDAGFEEGWRKRERYGDGGRRPWLPAKGTPHRRDWINPNRRWR